MMQKENLGPLINELCRTAGQQIGIEFHAPPPFGTQISGGWELNYQPKGLSWKATFTYWLSPNSYLKESVVWPFGFQTKQQNSATFSIDVGAKLSQMQQWIRAI
jgi:hypothetical protein